MTFIDPRAGNLGYWCSAPAARFPDKVALIDLSRDPPRETTYAELERSLDRVAATLSRLGLASGDRLAMSISNRVEFVEIMFGAMRAGIVPVPLNTKLGPDTLRYVIEDSGCAGAAVESAANGHVADIVDSLGLETRLLLDTAAAGWFGYEDALAASHADFAPPPLAPDHLAFLPYTSGSTGKPKGVALTHAGQCWWIGCLQKYWPMPTESRALAAVPLYHKNAMAGAIKPLLSAGGSVVLLQTSSRGGFCRRSPAIAAPMRAACRRCS